MFWGKSRTIIVALEVGSTKVVAVVGEVRADGTLALLGIGEAPSCQVRKCEVVELEAAKSSIRDALDKAERLTNVDIGEVYLAISGAHIQSVNMHVTSTISHEPEEITGEMLHELHEMADEQPLPADHAIIHHLLQHYVLDDGLNTENPTGLMSRRITARFHQVHGLASRLQNTIRCVKELGIDVKGYALSSYATAQAVLSRSQKNTGAIVINLGGGVTDYIAYMRGAVVHSGVLGVGGEHLTNDIVAGLKLPYAKAELLKQSHGSVILDPDESDDIVTLPGSYNFEERSFYQQSLNTIMQARQAEIFEIILEDLQSAPFWHDFSGSIHLTGGASQVRGLLELANRIFPCPVELAHQSPFDGDQSNKQRPDLATVRGLLQYARQAERETPSRSGPAAILRQLRSVLGRMRLI